MVEVWINAYHQKTLRNISKLYRSLKLLYDTRFQKKNGIMCVAQQTSTTSHSWRELNWKNLICFFITPKIQGKELLRQQTCWRQCGHTVANHTHISWSCWKLSRVILGKSQCSIEWCVRVCSQEMFNSMPGKYNWWKKMAWYGPTQTRSVVRCSTKNIHDGKNDLFSQCV